MMNFKSIRKYWNFDGYNRIKVVKSKQKTEKNTHKNSKMSAKPYGDYLDKISGFTCCCKTEVCNCCCTYSLDGCCKKNTTQTYTTSTAHCICFTGSMQVRRGWALDASGALVPQNQIGYNDISGQIIFGPDCSGTIGDSINPFGSIYPKKTCEGLTIRSITYIANLVTGTPNIQITFSGDTFGGTFFKCIILTKDKTVIKLYRGQYGWTGIGTGVPNPQTWCSASPADGPFTSYYWRIPDNLELTEGTWCVQISM